MTKEKQFPDWERIELDYRSGILTLREIAELNGITHGAINKRAKRDGWVRDLNAKIRAKAAELVSRQEVSKEVSKEQLATEMEVIDANASLQANVLLSHRKDIQKGRKLAVSLLEELEHQTDDKELFERLGEIISSDDANAQRAFNKVISSSGRIDNLKKLSDTMKNLIALERQAIGLSDDYAVQSDEETITKIERVIIRG